MPDGGIEDRLQLEVPALPNMLATVRLFVASTARVSGVAEEAIDDLKLAVSEAASAVVVSGFEGALRVVVAIENAGLSVEVSPLSPDDLTGDDLHPGDIVRALFPEARLDRERSALVIPVGSGSTE